MAAILFRDGGHRRKNFPGKPFGYSFFAMTAWDQENFIVLNFDRPPFCFETTSADPNSFFGIFLKRGIQRRFPFSNRFRHYRTAQRVRCYNWRMSSFHPSNNHDSRILFFRNYELEKSFSLHPLVVTLYKNMSNLTTQLRLLLFMLYLFINIFSWPFIVEEYITWQKRQ